jgi:hypothetical protein
MEVIEAKSLRTFIMIYFLVKNECLSTNIKLNLYKALIRSVMIYACPRLGIIGRHLPLKIAAPTKQCSPHHLKFFNMHTSVHMAFNLCMYMIL